MGTDWDDELQLSSSAHSAGGSVVAVAQLVEQAAAEDRVLVLRAQHRRVARVRIVQPEDRISCAVELPQHVSQAERRAAGSRMAFAKHPLPGLHGRQEGVLCVRELPLSFEYQRQIVRSSECLGVVPAQRLLPALQAGPIQILGLAQLARVLEHIAQHGKVAQSEELGGGRVFA